MPHLKLEADNPFRILMDSYAEQSYIFYMVYKYMIDIPYIAEEEVEHTVGQRLEAKLYETAFAKMCHDFMLEVDDMSPMEDDELLFEEIGLIQSAKDNGPPLLEDLPVFFEKHNINPQEYDSESEPISELISIIQGEIESKTSRQDMVSIFHVYGDKYEPPYLIMNL